MLRGIARDAPVLAVVVKGQQEPSRSQQDGHRIGESRGNTNVQTVKIREVTENL